MSDKISNKFIFPDQNPGDNAAFLRAIMGKSANYCPAYGQPVPIAASRMCPLAAEIRDSLKGVMVDGQPMDHPVFNIPLSFNCANHKAIGKEQCSLEERAIMAALELAEQYEENNEEEK